MITEDIERVELLTIFMEEAAECQVEASKLIRFGSPTASNVHKLEVEVGDLICMIFLLEEYGFIDMHEVEQHVAAKHQKLKKWSNLTKLQKGEENEKRNLASIDKAC